MGRLGRAYRDGKGVPQDLNIAAEWMRKAADKDARWVNELFDILWWINSPESLEEMIAVIRPLAESNDPGAMIRLGRAYCNGKGVERNFDKSIEWMRKASNNTWWLGREFADNLMT